jgi:hypothetical protein
MENCFSSPDLAHFFKTKGIDSVGTLHVNRKSIFPLVKKIKKGEIVGQHLINVAVLAWQEKKRVTFISTYHSGEMNTISKDRKEIIKPKVALDYSNRGTSLSERPIVANLCFGTEEKKEMVYQSFQKIVKCCSPQHHSTFHGNNRQLKTVSFESSKASQKHMGLQSLSQCIVILLNLHKEKS